MRIGIDIIEVERVISCIESSDRMARMYTKRELEYFQKKNYAAETVAGIFSAKEAFFKALGTGMSPSAMLELEVMHDQYGAPYYNLSSRLVLERHLSTARIQLSISHTKDIAVAVCVIVTSLS